MKKGLIALSPLGVFITLYLVTSIIAGDFYKVPITVAFMMSSIYAIMISTGQPVRQRIDIYSRGAGNPQMMLMIWIFILAGAFAHSAKVMGCIDATVNLTLYLLPGNMLLAGLFLAACFISISIGTSVGTIVALTPIAAGVAAYTGTSIPLMTAVVVGGSFFGDNLSFISDTTIVATSTQGCKLSDKFRVNAYIVFPAALLSFFVYLYLGADITSPQHIPANEYTKVIPYIVVLFTAIMGMNVMAVLTLGILLTGCIGLLNGSFTIFSWMGAMGDGIIGMGELIIITMMAGGIIHGKRGAELSIAGLVSVIGLCTANNTVSIITVGGIAKQIGDRFGVDNKKCASILDTFSCFVQGIIPYGAQILMAAGLASIAPITIIPYLIYPFILGLTALMAILFRYPKKYS